MKAIVAVDNNWAIGNEGKLLEHIPEDMKFFKNKTINKVVVMGRETFESLPGMKPLKDRVNIVLTKNDKIHRDDVIICNSIEQTIEKLKDYNDDDIFIIGGESIYRQFLKHCDEVFVTKIQGEYLADKFFVDLDNETNWVAMSESEEKTFKSIKYNFFEYKKI